MPSRGVLNALGRGVRLEGGPRSHLDYELDVITDGAYVIRLAVANDYVGVTDVELMIE